MGPSRRGIPTDPDATLPEQTKRRPAYSTAAPKKNGRPLANSSPFGREAAAAGARSSQGSFLGNLLLLRNLLSLEGGALVLRT